MRTIALMAQKGGAGKTTLAVHLAVAAGPRAAVLDLDPQRSAVAWSRARAAAGLTSPIVAGIALADLSAAQEAARGDRVSWLILDTPPHASAGAAAIAEAADVVLIPVRPSALDVAAVDASVRITARARARAFVLSACPPRAPEVEETRAALAAYGVPVWPGTIGERRPYARAIASGRAVTEPGADPSGKARDEIAALLAWLRRSMRAAA